ncbi:MAG: indolepyruvate ferredoxin oxidoreductase subunit alpha [Candidatus Bathyarchaeia archaeon]
MPKLVNSKVLAEGKPGSKQLLLGNEAIARGLIEGGVSVATTYPGTPASEIVDSLAAIAEEVGIYVEYSTNEKVALEVAAGASLSGLRSSTSMKMVGLNVAADALMTLGYLGVRGGMVIITADDPNCHSSQNEQDNRYYALMANIPCLEPSDPQEAKDMVLDAYRISEELELPILYRSVTRLSHSRRPVVFGEVGRPRKAEFKKDYERFVMVPSNARVRHVALLEKMESAKRISDTSSYNKRLGDGEFGIITSGNAFNYVMDAIGAIGADASVLKIGMIHPLPERRVLEFLADYETVLVIEELEPFLEMGIRALANKHSLGTKILGKEELRLPRHGELSIKQVALAISKALGRDPGVKFENPEISKLILEIPARPPILCPGCPHRASFYAIKASGIGDAIFITDIGCYALGSLPPLSVGDVLLCMGASAGLSAGVSKATGKPVVGIVGDSTFFHASIPALINAVYNHHRFVYVVLDNMTTAMTNFQPHPGSGLDSLGRPSKRILIEDVARGCGVELVRVIDPFDLKSAVGALKEALAFKGPSVVIFRRECAILEAKRAGGRPSYVIDEAKCTRCLLCINRFGCPAIMLEKGPSIDPSLCNGCGFCAKVCPQGAIGVLGDED